MGRKSIHYRNPYQSEFVQKLDSLCTIKSLWQVWSDFVAMASLSIANALDRTSKTHDVREEEYLAITRGYSTGELTTFAELLSILVLALEENPEQDFLGELFSSLNLMSHWKGQFFTPYHIGRLMSTIGIEQCKEGILENGWTSITDPCCGAGSLLIAMRNEMVRQGFNSQQALYVAQDIDRTTAMMCFLQLSLLGCAGYVVVGNSLTHPVVSSTGSTLLIAPLEDQEVWIMPALYDKIWHCRMQFEKLRLLIEGETRR